MERAKGVYDHLMRGSGARSSSPHPLAHTQAAPASNTAAQRRRRGGGAARRALCLRFVVAGMHFGSSLLLPFFPRPCGVVPHVVRSYDPQDFLTRGGHAPALMPPWR